jgi:hypothetical protein
MSRSQYESRESGNLALGQAGSAYLDADGSTLTPSGGGIIVAITALTDCTFDTLTAEGGAGLFFNTAGAGAGGDTFTSSDIIPKGVTIFGRWTSVSVNNSGEKCICYLG